jgi:hypothetical protein
VRCGDAGVLAGEAPDEAVDAADLVALDVMDVPLPEGVRVVACEHLLARGVDLDLDLGVEAADLEATDAGEERGPVECGAVGCHSPNSYSVPTGIAFL